VRGKKDYWIGERTVTAVLKGKGLFGHSIKPGGGRIPRPLSDGQASTQGRCPVGVEKTSLKKKTIFFCHERRKHDVAELGGEGELGGQDTYAKMEGSVGVSRVLGMLNAGKDLLRARKVGKWGKEKGQVKG